MDTKIVSQEFAQKVMYGLTLAVQKLHETAAKNNQPLVISVNGKIEHIYPKKS
jgi:hypothetical protein